jgi:hypothetical protein
MRVERRAMLGVLPSGKNGASHSRTSMTKTIVLSDAHCDATPSLRFVSRTSSFALGVARRLFQSAV